MDITISLNIFVYIISFLMSWQIFPGYFLYQITKKNFHTCLFVTKILGTSKKKKKPTNACMFSFVVASLGMFPLSCLTFVWGFDGREYWRVRAAPCSLWANRDGPLTGNGEQFRGRWRPARNLKRTTANRKAKENTKTMSWSFLCAER